jgi:Domain of unknown function (DUF4389)
MEFGVIWPNSSKHIRCHSLEARARRRCNYGTDNVSRPVLGRLPRSTTQSADHILPRLHGHPYRDRAGDCSRGNLALDVERQHRSGRYWRLLFLGPLLMIVFRQKYPRWWFDWNLELQRLGNRVGAYLVLMDDRYPSTTDQQSVHLDYAYPDAERDLNRWLPLVKWFLAIPHYVVLFFLNIALVVVVIIAWFAILFTEHYPRGLFDFVEGVIRWNSRVAAYAFVLVTDQYPPFRLSP